MESELGDERLQEIWRRVVEKYEVITNEKLEQNHDLTVEEMQERLSDIFREGRGEIVKRSAETVFNVAQYAAEAASTVFPYASTVFGALTAIKSTVEDYQENFTKKRILEKLNDAARNLIRIQAYMKMSQDGLEIDAALKASIVQLFTRILMLCMIYQKVEKDSRTLPGRAKNLLKAAIGYDGGIASHLSEIEDETAREISNNVAALRVSDTYAKSDRNLKKLQEYLEIGDTVPGWVMDQKKLESANIKGMGEWLHRRSEFASWANVEKYPQVPVLVFRTGQGHGKSHLCSQVIRLLGGRANAQHQNISTSIAWYFFPKSGGGQSDSDLEEAEDTDGQPEEAKKQASLREALIALTWQLAQSDRAFQEHAVRQFRARPHGFSKAVEIWNEVIFRFIKDSKQDNKPRKVFFLVVDGSEDLTDGSDAEKNALRQIVNDAKKSEKKIYQIRLLLSGELKDLKADKITEICMFADEQQVEAEILIESRLEQAYKRWDKETEGYRILCEMENDVLYDFDGNYHFLNEYLDEIDRTSTKSLSDLQELKRRGLRPATTAERHLEMLNEELSDEEVELLNEVIAFLICKKVRPTIHQLKAYVSIRLGEKAGLVVDAQIHHKYPPRLIRILPNKRLMFPGLKDLFDGKENKVINSYSGSKRWGNRDLALEDNVTIPRRVLESIYDHEALNKSVVDTLKRHTQDTSVKRPRIQFNRLESEINMILSLLQAVCSHEHRERADSKFFYHYIAARLPRHFVDIKKNQLAKISKAVRQKIGSYLYRFFMEEKIVEIWMPKGTARSLAFKTWDGRHWEDHIRYAAEWLEDDIIRSNFKPADKGGQDAASSQEPAKQANRGDSNATSYQESAEHLYLRAYWEGISKGLWYKQSVPEEKYQTQSERSSQPAVSDNDPDAMFRMLLEVPTKVIASQWLQEYNWNALEALVFFMRVRQKACNEKVTDLQKLSQITGPSRPDERYTSYKAQNIDEKKLTPDLIETWEKKAMQLLGITEMQARRNSTQDVRLAETFSILEHYDKASNRCEFAQSRDHQNIKAALCLSHVREQTNKKKKALDELLKIRYTIQSANFRNSSPNEWQNELDRFWRLCDETGNAEAAIRSCRYLSKEFPDEPIALEKAAEWFERSGTLSGTIDLLSAPAGQKNKRRSLLTCLLLSNATSPKSHRKLCLELKGNQEHISKIYKDAVAASTDKLETAYLRYYHGVSLFYQQGSMDVSLFQRATAAAAQYEQCIAAVKAVQKGSNSPGTAFQLYSMAAERMASAYVEVLKKVRPKNAQGYINKVEEHKRWVDESHPYEVNYVALQLGRLYYLNGNREQARSAVKKHMILAFDLLKDGKEENDWKGYSMLAEALIPLEDDNNSRAVWSLMVNDPDRLWISDLSTTCAGRCGWTWADSKSEGRDVYICRDCPHTHFESACHEYLQKDLLEHRVCGRSHSFLKIPKRKKRDVNRIKRGNVLVGETEMTIEKWQNSIRHDYGIPNPDLPYWERAVESLQRANRKTRRKLNAPLRR